ncbi:MAG: phosphoribosylaminoimidazolesuccinocarboxamide synthase [Desulfosporosinus sp.]|nr:phosphoribosylaminoimidazolesuccinocarboxamide synthase [Desulfosporosinus sp.]
MEKLALKYEGKAKRVYATDQSEYLWVAYKDDATALNGKKKGTIHDKGEINNQLSALFFEEIEKAGIPTHYVRLLSNRDMLVRSLEMIPLEVVVRNVVTGSLGNRLAVPEGFVLSQPVVELYYKDDELGDPMVNETHIAAMGWASAADTKEIQASGLKINKILQEILAKAGIELIDFKLEFGIADGKVYLGDEISPDTCRYWDIETREKLDKDRFRQDLGRLEEAYQEVFRRVKEVLAPV